MIKIKVKIRNSYDIYVQYGIIKNIPGYLKGLKLGNLGVVITSRKIYSLYKDTLKRVFAFPGYKIIVLPDGEEAKSREWLFFIIRHLLAADGFNKKPFVVCLGGGTIGDVGGFAASIYKRGIPYVHVPTTLLSQVDSSIGGKTGIDLKEAKNILGAFYQPKAVFIDPLFLSTLPVKEIRDGLAEVIKYGVIYGSDFFDYLVKNRRDIIKLKPACITKIISMCVKMKAGIVEKDEYEKKGLRTILNFGHTLAHALEASLRYKKITHGQAVSIGMVYAACLSLITKNCTADELARIKNIITAFGLPVSIDFDRGRLLRTLSYDKKFISGKIRMVLVKRIGKVEVNSNISLQDVKAALKYFSQLD